MNKELAQTEETGVARESTRGGSFYRPDVDIVETQDELLVYADVPGAAADKISLHYERGELTLHVPVEGRQADGTRYLVQEYGVGAYHRHFLVNEDIDSEKISADYRDGVLQIHLPKASAAKPRKIAIRTQ